MSMLFQRCHQGGQKRYQTFRANVVGSFPGHEQCLLDLWAILRRTGTPDVVWAFRGMIEQPNG